MPNAPRGQPPLRSNDFLPGQTAMTSPPSQLGFTLLFASSRFNGGSSPASCNALSRATAEVSGAIYVRGRCCETYQERADATRNDGSTTHMSRPGPESSRLGFRNRDILAFSSSSSPLFPQNGLAGALRLRGGFHPVDYPVDELPQAFKA